MADSLDPIKIKDTGFQAGKTGFPVLQNNFAGTSIFTHPSVYESPSARNFSYAIYDDNDYSVNNIVSEYEETDNQRIYKFDDGTQISFDIDSDAKVLRNSVTGKLEIIGAKNATVKLSANQSIVISDSTVKTLEIEDKEQESEGVEAPEIIIQGEFTSVNEIIGNNSAQVIKIQNGAYVAKIDTKGGDDEIIINGVVNKNGAQENYIINTGDGNDEVLILNSEIELQLDAGKGNDSVSLGKSTISNSSKKAVDLGEGDGSFAATNSQIKGDVNLQGETNSVFLDKVKVESNFSIGGFGYGKENAITINDSEFTSDSILFVGSADAQIDIYGSKISNLENHDATTEGDKSHINIENSLIERYYSNTVQQITSNNSTINATYGTEIIDQSSAELGEEYKDYTKVIEPIKTENGVKTFKLPDGSTVELKNGRVLCNSKNEILIHNGQDVMIMDCKSNIIALNSIIGSCKTDGDFEAKNSIVQYVEVADNAEVILDDCQTGTIVLSEGNNIIVNGKTSIWELNAKKSQNISVELNSGNIEYISGCATTNLTVKSVKIEDKLGEEAPNIGGITAGKVSINQDSKTKFNTITIGKIDTENENFILNASNINLQSIGNGKENGKSVINVANSNIGKVTIDNVLELTLTNSNVSGKISKNINSLDSCTDSIKLNNSTVNEINISGSKKNESDMLLIENGSHINKLVSEGEIVIVDSSIDVLDMQKGNTNILAQRAHIDKILKEKNHKYNLTLNNTIYDESVKTYDEITGGYVCSVKTYDLDFNLTIDGVKIREASYAEEDLNTRYNEKEVYELVAKRNANEIQNYLLQNPDVKIQDVADFYYSIMQETLNAETNKNNPLYIQGKAIFDKIDPENPMSVINAYSVVMEDNINGEAFKATSDAIIYVSNMSNDDMTSILSTLGFMGLLMDYEAFKENGPIRDFISKSCNFLNIGTTEAEVKEYIANYQAKVKELQNKCNMGQLTPEELAIEYKLLTGADLNEDNKTTLMDGIRGNEVFDNETLEKIADYKDTVNGIYQVGEYIIIVGVGILASAITGGLAAPALAGGLTKAASLGIALTSTSASLVAKILIETTENNNNAVNYDDYDLERGIKDAALMYAGCLGGQLGNFAGDAIKGMTVSEQFAFIQKVGAFLLEEGIDIGIGVASTALITGQLDLEGEVLEELKSLLIGATIGRFTPRISNKVASWKLKTFGATVNGVHIKSTPLDNGGYRVVETQKLENGNTSVVTRTTDSDGNPVSCVSEIKNSNNETIETATTTKASNGTITTEVSGTNGNYTVIQVSEKGILRVDSENAAKLKDASPETIEKLAKLQQNGWNVDGMIAKSTDLKYEIDKEIAILENVGFGTYSPVKQNDDTNCATAAVLNAVYQDPMFQQAVLHRIDYNPTTKKYSMDLFGETFEFDLADAKNIVEVIFNAKQASKYGLEVGDYATRVLDDLMPGMNDVVVKASDVDLTTIKAYSESAGSFLTYNVATPIEVQDVNGKTIKISEEHAYTVLGADDNGIVRLQDPQDPSKVIEVRQKDIATEDAQFEGRTMFEGKVQDGVTPRMVAGHYFNKNARFSAYAMQLEGHVAGDIDFIPADGKAGKYYVTGVESIKFAGVEIKFDQKVNILFDPQKGCLDINSMGTKEKAVIINALYEQIKIEGLDKISDIELQNDTACNRYILSYMKILNNDVKLEVAESGSSIKIGSGESSKIDYHFVQRSGNSVLYYNKAGVLVAESCGEGDSIRYLVHDETDFIQYTIYDGKGNVVEKLCKDKNGVYNVVDDKGNIIRPNSAKGRQRDNLFLYVNEGSKNDAVYYEAVENKLGLTSKNGVITDGKNEIKTQKQMADYLTKYVANNQDLKDAISKVVKNGGNCVINVGYDSDGNIYIGVNSVSAECLDTSSTINRMGITNMYQGSCAETALRTASEGAKLTVFDLSAKVDGDEIRFEEYPPCSTCSGNFGLWGWTYAPSV